MGSWANGFGLPKVHRALGGAPLAPAQWTKSAAASKVVGASWRDAMPAECQREDVAQEKTKILDSTNSNLVLRLWRNTQCRHAQP